MEEGTGWERVHAWIWNAGTGRCRRRRFVHMVGANPPPEPVPDEGGVSNEQRLKKKKV